MVNGTATAGAYLQIALPSGLTFCVTKYFIEQNAGWNNYLNVWYLLGSNNGTNFTNLDYKSNMVISNGTATYITISNTIYYSYYRLLMIGANFDSALYTLLQLFGNAQH